MAPRKTVEINPRELRLLERADRVIQDTEGKKTDTIQAATSLYRKQPVLPYETRMAYKTNYADKPKKVPGKSEPKQAIAKVAAQAPYTGTYHNLNGLMYPEYPLLEAFTLYDTEVYVKQAIARKLALVQKAGWEIISDTENNKQNITYVRNRLAAMEYVSGRSTSSFFTDILECLLLCSNCFLLKVRDVDGSGGIKNERNGNKVPIAAYQIIPPHQLMPYLKKGKIAWWRRFYETGSPFDDISVDDIVHLTWDVKPGHIFGTPRIVAVRDDIFALRRLEENIELLFINHLFPLFHVQVGTEKDPCYYGPNGESEISLVRHSIENMPKEGVFVTDERVSVDAVGAQGNALETKDFLEYWKKRIFCGLGVSSVDMGEADTANSSTADNISQNLKDLVKSDLKEFSDLVRMNIFKDLFLEAPYSLSVRAAVQNIELRFHEIDLDSKIKYENHTVQLFLNNGLTEDEYRTRLQLDRMTAADQKKTHYWLHIRDLAIVTAKAKADASPGAGMAQSKETPSNQHGTKLGPGKGKSSLEAFSEILSDKLASARQNLLAKGQDLLAKDDKGQTYWANESSQAVNEAIAQFNDITGDNSGENPYTKKLRTNQDKIKGFIALIPDPEMLAILLDSGVCLEDDPEEE